MSDAAPAHVVWGAVTVVAVAPGIERQVVHGDGLTMLRLRLAAGTVLARHEHPHEQCTTPLSGRLAVDAGAGTMELGPGESVVIPGGVPHEARALTDVLALEIFVPAREDLPAS
jgi:quercetin dioxygenase-like cupin family protein